MAIEDSVDIGINLNNIGIIYEEVRNYEKAKAYLKRAIAVREKISDSVRLSSSYLNLGITYTSLGILDSAELMLKRALELKKRDNDIWGMAGNLGNLGVLYQLKDSSEAAQAHFKKSIDLAMQIGAKEVEITSKIYLTNLLIKSREYSKAQETLSGLKEQISHQTLQTQVDYYKAAATTQTYLNNHSSASYFWETYVNLLDSLDALNDERLLLEAQFQLHSTLREEELKREGALKRVELEQSIRYRKQINQILIAFCVLIFIGVIFLLRNYKLLQSRNQLLKEQGIKINALLSTQEELLKKKSEELISSKEIINRYAFLNSHELRAPVAKILGVLNVIDGEEVDSEYMLNILSDSIQEIDLIVRKIAKELHHQGE